MFILMGERNTGKPYLIVTKQITKKMMHHSNKYTPSQILETPHKDILL